MKKLSKKLEITLNHTKTGKFQVQKFSRIIIPSNFPWKNKKNFQNIQRSTKINHIKLLKLDKKEYFGRKIKIHQLNF